MADSPINVVTLYFFTLYNALLCIADRGELDLWTKSIKFMINHFVQKYGINYVSQWNFESWNEPDHQIHNPFGGNNITYRQSHYI